MKKGAATVLAALVIIGFGIGFLWGSRTHHRIQIGGHWIEVNPKAVPDPRRTYTLQFWDYNLPLGSPVGVPAGGPAGGGKSGYRKYLERAVAAFQESHPNIKVEITLLDIVAGPDRLAAALAQNNAPDVYASAFRIPAVDYRRQIPAGMFLTPAETAEYPPALQRLVRQDQCLWALPRWTVPGLWIANRELLEKAGLAPDSIRATGWTWEQLTALARRLPAGQVLLAGNPAENGFFRQLAANAAPVADRASAAWNGRSVAAALELLQQIGNVRPGSGRNLMIDQDFTASFLKGRALFLAGVRPILYPLLRPGLAARGCGGLFVPVPGRGAAGNAVVTENGVLCVYRNQRTRGEDQIAAAVKLARFLSCYREVDPWVQMVAVPAAQSAAAVWLDKAAALIGAPEAAYLAAMVRAANLQNLGELPEYQTQIYPALRDFLAGKTTPTQAQALMFDH